MAHPLPLSHAAAEPWFQALRGMAQDRTQVYGFAWPCRSLYQASIDVFEARTRQTLRAKNTSSNPLTT